jgi:dTDP-3-amino-3,4,6-trideoxy-alpha-D-glucose transaminase
MTIPLYDVASQVAELHPELEDRVRNVIRSANFILGDEVEAFEAEFAGYLGVDHAIGVGNGTEALTIALRALGVGPGDDVVVPSYTFFATAEAVVVAGAIPVFCDVDPDNFCITAESVERALTKKTRAVIPVHLFGMLAPMDELRRLADEHGFVLLEDAAQAAGARVADRRAGSLGDAAAFSFFPTKNLFCLGDGGAIVTNSEAVAAKARLLRVRGSPDKKRTFVEIGYNSRLDELQAAVLRVGLGRLDGWNARRRAFADRYRELGLGELVAIPEPPANEEAAYHMYVVGSDRRGELIDALREAGISARQPYAHAVHEQKAMRSFVDGVTLPATKRAVDRNIALPMAPARTPADARTVVETLRQALNSA